MTDDDIRDACMAHGAKRVYDAAYAHIGGNKAALEGVGLSAATIGDADRIGRVAFGLLGAADRAADLADITIKGAKL